MRKQLSAGTWSNVTKLLSMLLVISILVTVLPVLPTVHAASSYRVTLSTHNFGIQFLHVSADDLSNPQHAVFSLTNGAALWYGIEVQSQPSGLLPVAANPLDDLVSSEFGQYGLLPPSDIVPINTNGTFFETVQFAASFSGPNQQMQLTLNPFDTPAATFDVFNLLLQLLGEVSSNVQVGLLEPGHLQEINTEIEQAGDLVNLINDFASLLHAAAQHSASILGDANAFVNDLLKLFVSKNELVVLGKILVLIVGPAIPSIGTTLASYASGIHTFLATIKLVKFLADLALSLGSYLFQQDTFPTVTLQSVSSVTPLPALTTTLSPSSTPTLTPSSTPSPTPSPTPTPVPPTLTVSPKSFVNNFSTCTYDTHGGYAANLNCSIVLSNTSQTTMALNWSASMNPPYYTISPNSGTIPSGQSVTISFYYNNAAACPGGETLTIQGSVNTVQIPIACTVVDTTPDSVYFDNTHCTKNGNWTCIITLTTPTQNPITTPWVGVVQTPSAGITISPNQGTLAPGASIQVTITIASTDCPGTNYFSFYAPGALPNPASILGWSC